VTETTLLPTARTVLGEFAAFLRRPGLLAPQGLRDAAGRRAWLWMTALLIAGLLLVLAPLLGLWQKAFALPAPDAFKAVSSQMLVPIVVLIAPVLEELLFRGWQSGRARALWLLGCAAAVMTVLLVATDPSQALLVAGVMLAALIAAPTGWWLLRRRTEPLRWFARGFPAIFYLVAVGFALVHLTNYPRVSLLAVPLVLPQLWAGLVLGFVRQRLGLVPAMLTHAAANACSLGLALLSGG
jgi:membrane protease YdiL (CAAX protease family)